MNERPSLNAARRVTYSHHQEIRPFGVRIVHFHDNDGREHGTELLYEVQIKDREWERIGRPMALEVRPVDE